MATDYIPAARWLRPGGRLHLADFGRPHDPVMRVAFLLVQGLDGATTTRDHADGRVPEFVSDAGFESVDVTKRLRTVFGTVEYVDARN